MLSRYVCPEAQNRYTKSHTHAHIPAAYQTLCMRPVRYTSASFNNLSLCTLLTLFTTSFMLRSCRYYCIQAYNYKRSRYNECLSGFISRGAAFCARRGRHAHSSFVWEHFCLPETTDSDHSGSDAFRENVSTYRSHSRYRNKQLRSRDE